MAAQNGTLKNNGNDVYPKTLEMNVYDGNGNRLDQKLAQMSSDLTNLFAFVTSSTISAGATYDADYPIGYTQSNTRVVSWLVGGQFVDTKDFGAQLMASKIRIYNNSASAGTVELMLYKKP